MIRSMDKVQFESRCEISEAVTVLDVFLEEHPNAEEKQTATKLRDMLDVMYMEW